jgi:hypothetical protein|tara:strand:- start:5292 stop:5492 length:201 start_codon:yes stop_codon:yes gene_type:complete
MKLIAIATAASCILFGVSCSSTDLSGNVPIPFTNPASNLEGTIKVQPMPFKAGVGLEMIPRPAPKG